MIYPPPPLVDPDFYRALPNKLCAAKLYKDGTSLVGKHAVAWLKSNGYMRCSNRFGSATRTWDFYDELSQGIVGIPRETLKQLPLRDHCHVVAKRA